MQAKRYHVQDGPREPQLDGSVSVSRLVLVIVCFILGYMYHDTLKFLARLSYGLFVGKNGANGTGKPAKNSS